MTFALIMTLLATLLIGLGIVGIIYPVLPGSWAVLTGIVLWAFSVRAVEGWWCLGLAGVAVLAGMLAQLALTGRTLKREKIPNKSTLAGVVGAVIGMFLIPVVGLFLGFAVGLYASEAYRHRDLASALPSTLKILKSMGLGMLLELVCALLAGTIFTLSALTYFLTL